MEGNSLEQITVEEIEEPVDRAEGYEVVACEAAGRYVFVFLREKPVPTRPADEPLVAPAE